MFVSVTLRLKYSATARRIDNNGKEILPTANCMFGREVFFVNDENFDVVKNKSSKKRTSAQPAQPAQYDLFD